MKLAQINVARLKYPQDDPRVADFINNLDPINALADKSPGFVWRYQEEAGNVSALEMFDKPTIIVNMSLWADVSSLFDYVYKSAHTAFVKRRKEWFELLDAPHTAMWWIEEGELPTLEDAKLRLEHLERFGPTAYAFTFTKRFEAQIAEPMDCLHGTALTSEF